MFETAIGRCAMAWGLSGIVGVQLPEAREIDTRRRLLQQFPDAREMRPGADVDRAAAMIASLLRGEPTDLGSIRIDLHDVSPFDRRVYELVRTIPCGETRTLADIAGILGTASAVYTVAQALAHNAFPLIVPCHRVLESRDHFGGTPGNGGITTRRRLLAIEGALASRGPSLFDALFPIAPPRLPR